MNNHYLVVVDMQNDFITGSLGNENAVKIVPRVVKKILTHFGPIIATMDTHEFDSYETTLEGKMLPTKHCIELSKGWEIEREVASAMAVQGNFIGSVKKDTFASLDLPEIIKEHSKHLFFMDVDTSKFQVPKTQDLEFTVIGLDTDICVISNALLLRAEFPNSKITIDSRCCAGTTPQRHRAALEVAKSCQINVI